MRYPEFLKPGGKIGIVAPSFGATMEPYISRFDNALVKFDAMGYGTVIGSNCYESRGIGKSNTAEKCAEEINTFFTDNECDVIISCGGGETMCEDLSFVDFRAISESAPKWYMGFSDNTNLTALLPSLCDTAAIYGPCAPSFGLEPMHKSLYDALDVLTGRKLNVSNYDKWEKEGNGSGNPLESYNTTMPFEMKVFAPDESDSSEFSGRLIGGCLDCLTILCGTKFDSMKEFCEKYKSDGIIWFLEACDLTPIGVHRVLWQLENAGWFENVTGFIIGRPGMIDADGMGYDRFSAVTSILRKYNVPVVMDADIGHLPPMMPVISGACADVKASDNRLTIDYKLV